MSRQARLRNWAKILVAVAVFFAAQPLQWGAGAGMFLGLLVASLLGLVDARLILACALICLACCPLLIAADQHAWLQRSTLVDYYAASVGIITLSRAADALTTWAFYLLCIGLAGRIVSYVCRGNRDEATQ